MSSVRILESNADLTGIQLRRAVAEMFPPAVLFGKEICDLEAVHIELRDIFGLPWCDLATALITPRHKHPNSWTLRGD